MPSDATRRLISGHWRIQAGDGVLRSLPRPVCERTKYVVGRCVFTSQYCQKCVDDCTIEDAAELGTKGTQSRRTGVDGRTEWGKYGQGTRNGEVTGEGR